MRLHFLNPPFKCKDKKGRQSGDGKRHIEQTDQKRGCTIVEKSRLEDSIARNKDVIIVKGGVHREAMATPSSSVLHDVALRGKVKSAVAGGGEAEAPRRTNRSKARAEREDGRCEPGADGMRVNGAGAGWSRRAERWGTSKEWGVFCKKVEGLQQAQGVKEAATPPTCRGIREC